MEKKTVSLVLVKFAIGKFVKKKFNVADTDAMTAVFDTLRSLGMKAIVRYSYVQCEKPGGGFIFQEDAKKQQLLDHIGQVTPILKVLLLTALKYDFLILNNKIKQKSLDVIYVLQAGFIGCWGEWYFTRNYAVEIKKNENYQPNEAQKADRIEIMKLLLKAVPGRMVQLRTPALKKV